MKLLSIVAARSIWVADMNDFNPKGRRLYEIFLPFLLDVYKFKTYPDPRKLIDLAKDGLTFQAGEVKGIEGELINVNLNIFNFGMIADTTSSTADSDTFLETLLIQLQENFNLPHYKNIIRMKNYLSQLVVTTDKLLSVINPKLTEISKYLSDNVVGFQQPVYEMAGVSFWADPVNAVNPTPFSFERQASKPFSENRYFSAAQLQTDKHLELLDKLEGILS